MAGDHLPSRSQNECDRYMNDRGACSGPRVLAGVGFGLACTISDKTPHVSLGRATADPSEIPRFAFGAIEPAIGLVVADDRSSRSGSHRMGRPSQEAMFAKWQTDTVRQPISTSALGQRRSRTDSRKLSLCAFAPSIAPPGPGGRRQTVSPPRHHRDDMPCPQASPSVPIKVTPLRFSQTSD